MAIFFGLTHELDDRRWIDRYTWRRLDAGITVASRDRVERLLGRIVAGLPAET